MPSLHELQTQFSHAIFGPQTASSTLLAHCSGAPEQAQRGLSAYRESILANLAGAVYASYPTLETIVGADFLRALCRRYALHSPSDSGDLNRYGEEFDLFLADQPEVAELPYLPAVARLDWLIQTIAAAQEMPQDLSRLVDLPPEHWNRVCFTLDPAHACLASSWPIATLWRVNQPDYDGDFQVDFSMAETVLVQRRPHGIVVERLSAANYLVLRQLAAGKTLGEAVESVTEQGASFDLTTALTDWIEQAIVRHAYLREKNNV